MTIAVATGVRDRGDHPSLEGLPLAVEQMAGFGREAEDEGRLRHDRDSAVDDGVQDEAASGRHAHAGFPAEALDQLDTKRPVQVLTSTPVDHREA